MEGYRAGRIGFVVNMDVVEKGEARLELKHKLDRLDGPFENAPGGTNDWGPKHDRTEAIERAFSYVDSHALGARMKIRGSRGEQPTYVLQRTFLVLGPDVIQAGLTQLGCRYVWADVNPVGSAGGWGSGFDCSGFTMWCHEQVGVVLQHSAEAQRTDSQVLNFNQQSLARPGDLVFMWFPNDRGLSLTQASHVGLWVSEGRMLDTRSVTSPVAVRAIETGSVVSFGRIPQINGRLTA